jgi:hypothetical protein
MAVAHQRAPVLAAAVEYGDGIVIADDDQVYIGYGSVVGRAIGQCAPGGDFGGLGLGSVRLTQVHLLADSSDRFCTSLQCKFEVGKRSVIGALPDHFPGNPASSPEEKSVLAKSDQL